MRQLIILLINTVISLLNPSLMRKFADKLLDFIEEFVEGTKSTVDDEIVLPLVAAIRKTFGIDDGIDEPGDDWDFVDLFKNIVTAILSAFTPDLLKKFADVVLDFCEDYVIGTASMVDDMIVLPICAALRRILVIPDNDPVPLAKPPDPGNLESGGGFLRL